MISPLRAKVIEVLEQAGCRNREDHLPVHSSGGTFSVIGGDFTGCNMTADWWGATPEELAELLGVIAGALRAAGVEVRLAPGARLYVPPVC